MEEHSAFFYEKRKTSNKIILVGDNDTIISDDQSIFFKNATKRLKIQQNSYIKDE